MNSITAYLAKIKKDLSLGLDVVWHEVFESKEAEYGRVGKPWTGPLESILSGKGINELFSHQVHAIDLIRGGKNVVVATPTASGKSKCAIKLAGQKNSEIISVDSRQIFKEIPFFSGAVSKQEMGDINHHFIGELSLEKKDLAYNKHKNIYIP